MNAGDSQQRVLTVSDLTLLIRDQLEQGIPDLWVEGEVSNLRTPGSGHLYFTLKDQRTQVRAVLFRGNAHRLRFDLREGMQVLVRGRVTVYEPRGEYQLILDYLEPKGIGALQIEFEQRKEKLAGEGLFDEDRKRPLPMLPRRIGIVTSSSGAALRDILSVLNRRCPILGVVIFPVPVQGEGAAEKIAEGIQSLNATGLVDVMIVGRGGGSWEDLWCFNEEIVVRAIAESSTPVVSAVGHEIDFTLADLAADCRAPTPSAAAEIVGPELRVVTENLLDLWLRLERIMQGRIAHLRDQALGLPRAMPLIRVRLLRHAQHVDELFGGLGQSFRYRLSQVRQQAVAHRHSLGLANPSFRIRSAVTLLQQLGKRMVQGTLGRLQVNRQQVMNQMTMLDSLSPLAVLQRGYSLVQTVPRGRIVRDAREVSVDEDVSARLAKGRLLCRVKEVLSDP